MVNHWLGVIHAYTTLGLLLICYGCLPRLINPFCWKVLNKHAVQLQLKNHRLCVEVAISGPVSAPVHSLCLKLLRLTFPEHHCKDIHTCGSTSGCVVSDLLVSFRCGLMMAMAWQKLCNRRQAVWSFQSYAQCSKP